MKNKLFCKDCKFFRPTEVGNYTYACRKEYIKDYDSITGFPRKFIIGTDYRNHNRDNDCTYYVEHLHHIRNFFRKIKKQAAEYIQAKL